MEKIASLALTNFTFVDLFYIYQINFALVLRQNQNILDNNDWISEHLMALIFCVFEILGVFLSAN